MCFAGCTCVGHTRLQLNARSHRITPLLLPAIDRSPLDLCGDFFISLPSAARAAGQVILRNLNRATTDLDLSGLDSENINGLVTDARVTVRKIGELADEAKVTVALANGIMEEDVPSLLVQLDGTLSQVDQTLSAFEGTSGEADLLIVDMRDAINRISNSGLTDLEETVDAIRRLVLSLGRVADALEQSPLEFISGTESDTVELPQ